ncbi:hypothetical protein GCK72_006780 [Caenorhabditis remanei]|uniref:CC domain-containing protein n=1 Tax=Caenorhabditis remanei TaxID=31234 RepID=A0A6A5HLT2_CAERE|nr:hypothetical protein GCK72_006780 [Caenorhabditis remanei]KAF1766822.1 hypothetical protein GCK72_006780 [Caenorhabditis remanei]
MIKSLLTILVLSVCCSDAVNQFCRGVTTSAVGGTCPSGYVVIYGNKCCTTNDYYEMSSLACKGNWNPANYGGCPNGQSIFNEHYCCDNKDIYDTTTASCKAGGVIGLAVNQLCGTNYYSRVVKFDFEIIQIIDK